jgi:hypothetical protein
LSLYDESVSYLIVFFSHNKLANNIFSHGFSDKQTCFISDFTNAKDFGMTYGGQENGNRLNQWIVK